MTPLKSTKLYSELLDEIIVAVEGTGDNLLDEDEEEGYVDYILAGRYEINGDEITLIDNPQIMLKKLVAEMTQEEFEQAILDYWGLDKRGYKSI